MPAQCLVSLLGHDGKPRRQHGAFDSRASAVPVDAWPGVAFAALCWTAAYAAAAGTLFGLTLLTFDGCLGRIPDAPGRPKRRRTLPSESVAIQPRAFRDGRPLASFLVHLLREGLHYDNTLP